MYSVFLCQPLFCWSRQHLLRGYPHPPVNLVTRVNRVTGSSVSFSIRVKKPSELAAPGCVRRFHLIAAGEHPSLSRMRQVNQEGRIKEMDGEEVNAKLERGWFGKVSIKKLHVAINDLQQPSDPNCANGVNDSVTQQAHEVDATWTEDTGLLSITSSAGGPGLWIPYMGNGMTASIGVAQTANHGLGTYTPLVGAGGASWVATGPFSGCYAVEFTVPGPGGGKVFAHVITAEGQAHPAKEPAAQVLDIANELNGAIPPTPDKLAASKPSGGIGFVFWTLYKGSWWRREIFAGAGNPCTVFSVRIRQKC